MVTLKVQSKFFVLKEKENIFLFPSSSQPRSCFNKYISISDGTAYGFLPNPGVMLYQWTNYYPSPREDNFALAFSSAVRNALLFKVTGNLYNGARDYLELALVSEPDFLFVLTRFFFDNV